MRISRIDQLRNAMQNWENQLRQIWRCLLKLFLFGSLLNSNAQASNYKLVTLDFPPLEMLGENGKVIGAVTDIVREVFQKIGHRVEINLLPWTRALALTKDGKADGIFTIYRLPEREQYLDYSTEEIIPQVVSLYAEKSRPASYRGDLQTIVGSKVGTVSSISYGKIFDDMKNRFKIESVDTLELNFKKLVAKRIDYVVSNRYSAAYTLAKLALDQDVVEVGPPIEVIPSYIAFSKKNKLSSLRDRFDAELVSFKKSARYRQILKHYRVELPKTEP